MVLRAAGAAALGTTAMEARRPRCTAAPWPVDLGGPDTTPVVPSPRTPRTTVVVDAGRGRMTAVPTRPAGVTELDRVPGG